MESQTLIEKRTQSTKRILNAAANVFSEVGFAGARVDEIAKRAGINKAMIYYRIGDKKALYDEVLHDIFADTAQRIAHNIKETQAPEEKLKTFIRNIARTVDQHHHLAPIMMREFASGTRNFPEAAGQDLARIVSILTAILKEGEKKGVFIKTNPFLIHMMIVGTIIFYKMSAPIKTKQTIFPESLRKLDKHVSGDMDKEIEKLLSKVLKK
jgi:TetR/AcrR family transcriptional regulator